MSKPVTLSLVPLALVETPFKHFLKLRRDDGTTEWLPLSYLNQPADFNRFVADRFGVAGDHKAVRLKLINAQGGLHKVKGTARLGWSADNEVFLFGSEVLPTARASRYEFLAPDGTALREASEAFTPRGDREEQYAGLSELWERGRVA